MHRRLGGNPPHHHHPTRWGTLPLQLHISLNEAIHVQYKRNPHNLFYFWIAANAVILAHCFFSIREVASATMADVTPGVTDVPPDQPQITRFSTLRG